jgi:hypothetical protein
MGRTTDAQMMCPQMGNSCFMSDLKNSVFLISCSCMLLVDIPHMGVIWVKSDHCAGRAGTEPLYMQIVKLYQVVGRS